ncbi:MAG TPA: PilZ domain-containing protein [Kofleriaceae bacterium]|nr:PilZ domain-containing protein [Kofleriaceae bacterium]
MRLVTLAYETADEFLASYAERDGGTISVKTRTDGTIGEKILVEISFPGLPNRALLRATVASITFEQGLRLTIDEADASTRDFMLSIARGDNVLIAAHRDHARFPTTLHARWSLAGAKGSAADTTIVEDISAGGAFVQTATPPDVGATVELTIAVPVGPMLETSGHVAWVRHGKSPGFGVDFDALVGDSGRRLRALLRHASATAEVELEA